jgi:hypothetical protein
VKTRAVRRNSQRANKVADAFVAENVVEEADVLGDLECSNRILEQQIADLLEEKRAGELSEENKHLQERLISQQVVKILQESTLPENICSSSGSYTHNPASKSPYSTESEAVTTIQQ